MKKMIISAAVLGLLLVPSTAFAQQPPNEQLNPAQACRELRQTDSDAFREMFGERRNAFGRCVAFMARMRGQAQPGQNGPRAQSNPARTCRAMRRLDEDAFEEMFGEGRNAHGKCVSTIAKTRGGENGGDTP